MQARSWYRYAVVVLVVAAVTLLRWPLWRVLGSELAFLLFWPTVVFCAWYGGLGPGLLATLLSSLASVYFLIGPNYSVANAFGLIVFVVLGGVLSGLMEMFHQARARAVAEREWLQVILASIGDAVITADAEGRVTFLNPVAESLTGWRRAEATGRPLDEIFPILNEVTREKAENPARRVLREGVITGLANHTVLVARDGTERPIDDSAAPLRDPQGVVTGVVLVFRDVTERHHAQETKNRLAAIVESSEDAVVGKTLEGVITSWNKAAERLYGYAADEIVGKHVSALIPPEQPEEVSAILDRVRRGERIELYETVRVRKNGTRINVALSVSPIKDAAGRIVGAAKIARDVTERKRMEDELNRRTQQLAEADRRKDEWIAMLAHELRGPLSPVRNAVEVLNLRSPPLPELKQAREIIARQAQHMARLIDDLLDVTRIARGRIQLREERLDLARLTRTAAEDYRRALEQAGLTLIVEVPETPVWVTGDATRLVQVLENLLSNAGKFTDQGGRVTVRLMADAAAKRAVLDVRDTGCGIEAAMLPQLFEPLSQADKSLHRTKGGLGLGLALVKGLTDLHGGSVEARSEGPGRGAEFVITLPLEAEPAALAPAPVALRSAGKGLRVLVVEDNRDAAESLRILLELLGHEVRLAFTGPEGVRAAQEWRPSVIISDIGLPGLDGFGVARELRRSPATARVPLIAVTGYGSEEDSRLAKEAGYDYVLKKPADPEVLQELLAATQ